MPAGVLTAAEQRRLRGRRVALGWAAAVAFAALALALFLWPAPPFLAEMLYFLAAAAVLFPLHVRAVRCPRCGGNLFIPPGAGEFAPERDEEGGPLPDHCRACGVGLGGRTPGDGGARQLRSSADFRDNV